MKVLIYTFSEAYTQDMAIDLIPMGIEGIEVHSKEEAFELLKKDPNIAIFLTESNEISFLEETRANSPTINIFLIVRPALLKPAELKKLSQLKITAVIPFAENTSLMAEEIIKNIIEHNIKKQERRMHLRIQPKEHEKIAAAIYIRNLQKFVRGNVINISAGGVAIQLFDSLEASILNSRTIYDPIILFIHGAEIKTIATLISKRNDAAGFKFDHVETKNMKRISEYIHYKITQPESHVPEIAVKPNEA
jgi:hypothetical protein